MGIVVLRFVVGLFVLAWFSSTAWAETRIALIIGNSHYEEVGNRLANPVNDAELMAKTLSAVGFSVTKVVNAGLTDMRKAMTAYSRALAQPNTVGVFYYAGHGMQVEGQNYLLPVDASLRRQDELAWKAVAVNQFLRTLDSLSGRDGRLNVVILDACRNNPFARGWRSVNRGLATVDAPSGTLIAFATAPGDVAADGEGGNSPYTLALAEMIKRPGLAIEQTFKGARNLVWKWTQKSGKAQIPWESTSLTGDFYFVPLGSGKEVVRREKLAGDTAEVLKRDVDKPASSSVDHHQVKKIALSTCPVLGAQAKGPFPIFAGSKFCSLDAKSKALIKTIRKKAIVFSVNGEKNVVCTIKDICQFNWPGAPLFKVSIGKVEGGGQGYQGKLLPQ